jgi:hypothetical protein
MRSLKGLTPWARFGDGYLLRMVPAPIRIAVVGGSAVVAAGAIVIGCGLRRSARRRREMQPIAPPQ